MTKTFGGGQTVAEKANPELRSLSAILEAICLRLAVERVKEA
jgi:DNA-binding phage protein